jgi:PAS domain S-box-containing protein
MTELSKTDLLKEINELKAENSQLKKHSNFFHNTPKINFKSFEKFNQNLHEYFDSANDMIQVFSLDEKLLFVNASWEKTLKYTKKQTEKLQLKDIVHPDHLALIRQCLIAAKSGNSKGRIDTVFINSSGRKIHVIGNFNCIYEDGEAVGYTGIFYDNSAKVKAERAQKLYYQIANLSIENDKIENVLEEIHKLLKDYIDANNFHVALKGEGSELLTFPYYVDENFGGRVKAYSREFGHGLSEYTIRTERPQFLFEEDIKALVKKNDIDPFGEIPKVWLGVPLRLDKKIIGVIVVKSHSDRNKYEQQDLELLDFISGQTALVIGRRQYEDQLIAKRAKLRAILESSQHIIWSIDKNDMLTSFNENYAQLVFKDYGVTLKENELGDTKRFLLSKKEDEDFLAEKYKEAFLGKVQHFETMVVSNEGKTIWRETYLSPIFLPDRRIEEVSGISHDITEKKLQGLTVQESEEKFRNIFESFQDIYFRTDLQGKVTLVSPSIKEVAGYEQNELIDKNLVSFYTQDDDHSSVVAEILEKGKVKNYEATIVTKSGEHLHSIANLRLIYSLNKKPIGFDVVVRDITHLKKASEEAERARDLAEYSLKVKEQFLANMSHEIRTPMNGLIAMIDLLNDTQLDSEQEDYISTIKNSSTVLLDLLNDILDLSKLEAGRMELHKSPIRILNTFEKIHALFYQKAVSKGLKFTYEVGTELERYFLIDETRLIQVLANLTSNSVKFTDSGRVTIRATQEKEELGVITLKFEVIDTGIGIHEKDVNKLFHKFNQLDNSTTKNYAGTGLGLSISQDLVDLMGGKIQVDSVLDAGSKFWFTTEVTPVEVIDDGVPKQEFKISDSHFGDYIPHVLVVDDNSVNRKVAKAILSKAGCKIRSAKNGYEAITAVQKNSFDMIFMDIQMPEMDGLTAMKKIQKLSISFMPPIIAMTAYSLSEDKKRFISEGFDGYISKPITAKKLLLLIKKEIEQKEEQETTLFIEDEPSEIEIICTEIWNRLEVLGGYSLIKEIYQEFIDQTTEDLHTCKVRSVELEREEILRLIHTLKGTASTLGASQLAEEAKKLETNLKKGKISNFSQHLKGLTDAFNHLITAYNSRIHGY